MKGFRSIVGGCLFVAGAVYGVGFEIYRFCFRPELTEPQAFWEFWPYYLAIMMSMIVGFSLISKGN